jgi:hypothetical protein
MLKVKEIPMQVAVDFDFRNGFTQIPNALFCLSLDTQEKVVFFALLSYKWDNQDCWPSQARLSRDTGVPQRTLIRVLKRLAEKMIISYKRRGYGKTNRYEFLDQNIMEMIARLMGAPRVEAEQASEQAKPEPPLDFSCLLESDQSFDQFASLPSDEPLLDLSSLFACGCEPQATEPQLSTEPIQIVSDGEPQIDPIKPIDQIDAPVSPINGISANVASLSSAKMAFHSSAKVALHEQNSTPEQNPVKKHTQSSVCAKSVYSLDQCLDYARSLAKKGIRNPEGYGRSIHRSGQEDERIAAHLEAAKAKQSRTETNRPSQQIVNAASYNPNCKECCAGWRFENGWNSNLVRCECSSNGSISNAEPVTDSSTIPLC